MKILYHLLTLTCLFKMVATEETPSTVPGQMDSPGTFGKLRQTLSSSLLNAQDKGKHFIYDLIGYIKGIYYGYWIYYGILKV